MAERNKLPFALVVGIGLGAGVLFGVAQAWARGNWWFGLATGVPFGVAAVFLARRARATPAFSALAGPDRREVRRAAARGEAVEPRLAAALAEHAAAVADIPFPKTAMRVAFGVMAAFGLFVSVLGWGQEGLPGLAGGAPLLVLGLVCLFLAVPLMERQRERAARSLDATRTAVRDHRGGTPGR
ncbi:hypothetical protein [Saccharothrix yanglingensis]|uniref:Uncharacterized protein n=1 Tax=Saccharothrix yanglingensis TaxID=659496 RepID=A0ABU0WZ98_9PSEU|nr:hypothetical protein [Saccharothrix yanglingensis]MDQ2585102.1 hypothetical protein [Saccharothrix yanglingensis]